MTATTNTQSHLGLLQELSKGTKMRVVDGELRIELGSSLRAIAFREELRAVVAAAQPTGEAEGATSGPVPATGANPAGAQADGGQQDKQATFNEWFTGLPEKRQAILRDDKWMLASAAFDAGIQAQTPSEDTVLLDWVESEAAELTTVSTGEDDFAWVLALNYVAKPHQREIACDSSLRGVIKAAREVLWRDSKGLAAEGAANHA